jgi:hypothetical protein
VSSSLRAALRGMAVLGLLALAIGLLGCEPELVVNERFVPTTVGIVTKTEEFQAGGQPRYRYLLLMGDGPPPWIIRAAGTEGAQSECFGTGLRAVDRGATVEIEIDRRRGLVLVFPKAPDFSD